MKPNSNKSGERGRKTFCRRSTTRDQLANDHPLRRVRTSPSSKEKGRDVVPEPHIDLDQSLRSKQLVLRQFSPSYTMPDGRVLLLKDSVKGGAEPGCHAAPEGTWLCRGTMTKLPTDLMPGLAEMCSHLVQAVEGFSADRERLQKLIEGISFRAKWRASDQQVKEKEEEVKILKKELADAKAAAELVSAELNRVKVDERDKIREADAKGYEAGIKRAALEYTQVAHRMVNDELEVRLPDFFKLRYAAGADAMAGVMAIQPESGFLKQLPDPIIPNLDLPYTEEECQPLPPEEDEEEMVDASAAEPQPQSNVAMGLKRLPSNKLSSDEKKSHRRRRSWSIGCRR
ncbi:hypothetical protein RHSIM_RhsimUnG0099000 [Rhododendron simsii]|uniref:Uncharacterized protein n=1 Tax=Rhododendron simsii TaxID=118357 RepID=A0A834FUZ3_RHOSS|nr:hypothetical protein RHSIM_RhsimUnG0099000 [Rhododendron simsii]